jgi:anti-sigma B factor antagonist
VAGSGLASLKFQQVSTELLENAHHTRGLVSYARIVPGTLEHELVREAKPLGSSAYLIALTGDFDLHTGPQLERRVLEALGRGASEIVIDLAEVGFIDSTTIGILMRTRKRLAPLKGRLMIVCTDRNILRLFEITALDRMFEIYPSRAEALEHVDGDRSH